MFIEKRETEYVTYRIPVLVRTNQGNLLGAYECRSDDSDWAKIDIKIISSEDNGETFKTLNVIKGDGATLNNPVFIVNGETVHLLYCKNYIELYHLKSKDGGKTFSEPENITHIFDEAGFNYTVVAVGPSHGIVHNGNILAPVWLAYNKDDKTAHWPSYISSIYSIDNGATWKVGEIIKSDELINPSECSLSVTNENKVIISIRNENGGKENNFRAFSISDNGYSNWGEVYFNKKMPDTICQGATYFSNGKIYHLNCLTVNRKDLSIKISTDNFETFSTILVDEIGGYSDFVVENDVAYVLYESDPWVYGLKFKKINLK